MPTIKYKEINFSGDKLAIVKQAVALIQQYRSQGYTLTLRQLYYQFVARDAFPQTWADKVTGSTNNERSYKKLGDIIADARLAGLIDWTAIEDRTREVAGNPHWDSPADIVEVCSRQFQLDKWLDQKNRVEVWVEKDALEGVVAQAARRLDVQYFSCRGYASATSLWDAGQRLKKYAAAGQTPIILHLGDHDPSGIDMSRDIEERVSMFMDEHWERLKFKRIALNMNQIEQYAPPPNPAKATDARYSRYVEEYGEECWELDALEPSVLDALIEAEVLKHRDEKKFSAQKEQEDEHRANLALAAEHWNNGLTDYLSDL